MALVTAIADRLELSVIDAKQLLDIDLSDTSADDLIALTIDAGKQNADSWCNNPFLKRNDLAFDDLVNWSGNSTGRTPADILVNDNVTDVRLSHSLPDRYVSPAVELSIPDAIKLGILEMIKFQLVAKAPNITSERIGDWQQQYSFFVSNQDRLQFVRDTYWQLYRLEPGF